MQATMNGNSVLTPEFLLEQWQGHRRLTRRVIEAFPEDKLFSYSIGGMRPFSEMAIEFLKMAAPTAKGLASGEWKEFHDMEAPKTKAELLAKWDAATAELNQIVPTIPLERFSVSEKAFGLWESTGIGMILYSIDNEIHHRGEGYVYLRSLGIEPPAFYDRS